MTPVRDPVRANDLPMAQTPHDLVAAAVNKGSDLATIEKLMDLRDRWEAAEAKKAYTQSMTNFKAECPEIFKDKKVDYKHKQGGGSTNWEYESLPNLLKTITPALSKYDLSVSWKLDQSDNKIIVTCFITHAFGHFESTSLFGPPDKSGNKDIIHATASTVSLLQRYTCKSILGIASRDMEIHGAGSEPKPKTQMITKDQLKQIEKLKKELDISDHGFSDGIDKMFEISNVNKLSKRQAYESINMLEAKKTYRDERNAKNN